MIYGVMRVKCVIETRQCCKMAPPAGDELLDLYTLACDHTINRFIFPLLGNTC